MNISGIKIFSKNQNNIQQNNQVKNYLVSNNSLDRFESNNSNSKPTFKANPLALQKTAQKILNTPELSQKFAGFLAAGFSALVGLAIGKELNPSDDKDLNTAGNLAEIFTKLQAKEEEKEVSAEQNLDVEKVESSEKTDETDFIDSIEDDEIRVLGKKDELAKVNFPKRRGRLTKHQTELKKMVENLELKKEFADKLSELCEVAVCSKEDTLAKYGFDTESLVIQSLQVLDKPEQFEAFINSTYEQYKNPTPEIRPSQTVEQSKIEATDDNIEVLNGIKIGSIPAEKVEHTRKHIKRAEKVEIPNETEPIQKPVRLYTSKTATERDYAKAIDKENGIFYFKIPGTVNGDVKEHLTHLLLKFQRVMCEQKDEHTKWTFKRPMYKNVLRDDVIQEITYHKNGTSRYKNLELTDADSIAEMINQEERFYELFDLHSTLRLIDRYVNFSSEIPIQEQCKNVLDKLFIAIQKALSNGVKVETYQDSKHNSYAARIVIEPDKEQNPEAYEIGGTFPLKITICEKQSDPSYYNKYNKTPIISTIFSKGL